MLETIASLARALLRSEPRVVALVAVTTLAGWLVGSALGAAAKRARTRLGRQLLLDLRLPAAATVGLLGLLWVTASPLILVPLGICWALAALGALVHLAGWLVTRAASPWKLLQDEERLRARPASERERFGERLGQEISRVREARGEPAATVVAVGLKVGGPQRKAQLWQLALQSARRQDVLHQDEDGTLLGLLPDASSADVERWLDAFAEVGPDLAVGRASFPEDGESVHELLDRAVTRMWLDQGAAPGELASVSSPRLRNPFEEVEACIPLSEADMEDVVLEGLDLHPLFNLGERGTTGSRRDPTPATVAMPVPVVPTWSPEGSGCG